ncbi:autotransporter domain-containing protein [Aminobacter sp. AP02]|uniref:autotransporter family protein n=1 Tax=Aminobacter sp. AP02 TaxID=2135737 RepID=UPI001304DCFB|nr:autotransporter domain-containing protein [Aminobacter sp. AP02]
MTSVADAPGHILCAFAAFAAFAVLLDTNEAHARCVNTTTGIEVTSVTGQPTSNQNVVCDTTPPNPTAQTTAISAAAGSTNVNVTVLPGAMMNSTVRAIGVVNNSTVLNQGHIMTSGINAFGMSATGTGSTLTNQGAITTSGTTSWGMDARGPNTTLVNSGTISVSGQDSAGIRTNALGTAITNSGTIAVTSVGTAPNFPSGILFQAGSSGTFVNQAGGVVSSLNGAGVRVVSDGLVTVRNAGTITSGAGFAVRFDSGNNTLILDTGSVLNGDVVSSGSGNSVRLQGTGTEDSNFTGVAAGNGFQSLVMEGSRWTLSGNATIAGPTASAVSVNSGTLVLGGTVTNGGGGGTTIAPGAALQLGTGGSSGTVTGNIVDNGTLVFNRSDVARFDGVISGSGSVHHIGSGTTILNANDPFSGGTSVRAGTLAVGDGSHLGAALSGGGPVDVAAGAALGGYGSVTGTVANSGTIAVANAVSAFSAGPTGTFAVKGDLTNSGHLQIGGTGVGNRLVVAGSYFGAAGATGALNTFLGADGSPSDRIVIDGGSASGMTGLSFTNIGGPGAQTLADGILVVEALNGATTNTFALSNFVSAGGYEYFLFSGGINPGTAENWYLRNSIVVPPSGGPPPDVAPAPDPLAPLPPGPLPADAFPLPVPTLDPGNPPIQPAPPTPGATPFIGTVIPLLSTEVPIASALPYATRQAALATLGTFHERRGGQDVLSPADNFSAAWARVFGQSVERDLEGTADPAIDGSLWGLQAGLDLLRWESEGGHRDVAGLFLGYSALNADVTGFALGWNNLAVGDLDVNATSIGAYWTHIGPTGWYLDGVLMGSFYGGGGTSRRNVEVDADGQGLTLSLEGGYPFTLSPTWKVEPQAQLIWQHEWLDDASSRFATVAFDTDDALTGRLGVRLEGEFETSAGLMQPYLKANLWQGFSGSDTVNFNVNPFQVDFGGTALELGGGLIASLRDGLSLHATAGYTFAVDGETNRAFEGNLGLSFKW